MRYYLLDYVHMPLPLPGGLPKCLLPSPFGSIIGLPGCVRHCSSILPRPSWRVLIHTPTQPQAHAQHNEPDQPIPSCPRQRLDSSAASLRRRLTFVNRSQRRSRALSKTSNLVRRGGVWRIFSMSVTCLKMLPAWWRKLGRRRRLLLGPRGMWAAWRA